MQLSPSMVVEVASNSAAGFGLRLVARLIDLLFGALVVALGGSIGAHALRVLASHDSVREAVRIVSLTSPTSIVWSLLGALLYCVTAEALGGATFGKLLLRLRVTSEDLTPSTFKGTLLRNVALFVDALGVPAYRSMSNSLMSQRYGDRWGHTVVLHANSVPPDSRRSTWLLLLGLFSGSVLWTLWVALSVVIRGL